MNIGIRRRCCAGPAVKRAWLSELRPTHPVRIHRLIVTSDGTMSP
jgi:hypothetical protein